MTDTWQPLSAAQLSILNAQRLDPTSDVFAVADLVEITGPVDVPVLVEAIARAVSEAQTLHQEIDDPVAAGEFGPARRRPVDPDVPVEVRDLRAAVEPVAAADESVAADLASVGGFVRGRPAVRQLVLVLADDSVWWYQRYHHLVIDGFGISAVTRRAAAWYRALIENGTPGAGFGALADLDADESAYDGSPGERADRAALDELIHPPGTGAPVPTALGGGQPTAAARRALDCPVPLDASTATALDRLTRADRRLTWADVQAAGWAAFVARSAGHDDVVLGVPMSARTTPAALRTPSMAVNVLPVRVVADRSRSLRELAGELASGLSVLRSAQRYRGERIAADHADLGESWLLRGPGLNLKPYLDVVRFGAATGRLRTVSAGPVDDVDLSVARERDGLVLTLSANPDRHTAADLRRMAAAYAGFLARLAAAPDEPTGSIPVRPAAPVPAALAGPALNRELVDVSVMLAAAAARYPDEVAVRCGSDALTFTELVRRVDVLAGGLQERGIGAEDVVALLMPRGIDAVVAIFGVLRAGAAYLPIDPAYPAERIGQLLDDAAPVLVLDAIPAADGDPTPPSGLPPANCTAYVIYTSGSTGFPKGVAVGRDSLAFLAAHHTGGLFADAERRAGRRLRAAHTASFSFDSSWEQLLWLLMGHELVIYDEDDRRDALELVAAIDRDRIDTLDVTPSMAAALVDCGLLDAAHTPALFLIGGEAAPEQLWRRLAASPLPSHNFYGPTEATVDALGAPVAGMQPSIGQPLAGTRVLILDHALQPVASGTPGELYLCGPHLARGYRGRSGLTASRFVAVPSGLGAPGERMYRTGDVVRQRPDCSVDYLGRRDDQVKIRGHRIELGEVTAALDALAGVRRSHVLAAGNPLRLLAYVVVDGADADTEAAIRAALTGRLPAHLVPATVTVLDEFPTTIHGKVDPAALLARTAGPAVARQVVAPEGDRERAVCAAFAAALAVPAGEIGVDDDFFVLGGDSISAITVAGRLRGAGWRLRPRDLFTDRTARRVALRVTAPDTAIPDSGATVVDAPHGLVPLPPIAADLAEAAPSLAAVAGYAQSIAVSLPADLSDAAVSAALAALVRRHPELALRVTEAGPTGAPERWTVAIPDAAPADPVLLRGSDAEVLRADVVGRLDPAAGVTFAAGLVRRAPADLLILAAHHLAVDGVSWRILADELGTLLAGGELPPVRGSSWRARSLELRRRGERGLDRDTLPHWQRIGHRPCDALGRTTLDPLSDTHGRATRRLVPGPPATVLDDLAVRYGARPDTVLAAALAVTLDRWAGPSRSSRRLLIGWETHGRDPLTPDEDLSGAVGWFTTEFPVALDLPPGADLAMAVRAARQARAEVPGDGYGHGVLRRFDPVGRDALAAAARPGVLLNYLGRFGFCGHTVAGELPLQAHLPAGLPLSAPLEVTVFVADDDTLRTEWTVGPTLAGAADALVDTWTDVLAEFAAHAAPGATVEIGGAGPAGAPLIPADCSLPGVDQAGIDDLEAELGPLLDIAPLSPLQEGLLYHALRDGADDVYRTATVVPLHGRRALSISAVTAALRVVVAENPHLDAVFVADRFASPAQLVPVHPAPAVVDADLSGVADGDAALDALVARAFAVPFDVTRPPLLRATVVRRSDHRVDLVLVAHHLILDGWSTPILIERLLAALLAGTDPAEVRADGWLTYRKYLRHIRSQPLDIARRAWAAHLSGLTVARLAPAGPTPAEPAPVPAGPRPVMPVPLSRTSAATLIERARAAGLTLSTVLAGAWATVLARFLGRADVVLGTTVAGRTVDLPGIEGMIGLLSTTVPVRVHLRPGVPMAAQLAQLQLERALLQDHDTLDLPEIEAAAGVVGPLFDSLLVVENYPLTTDSADEVTVGEVGNRGGTHYPITVTALPGADLRLVVEHDPAHLPAGRAAALAEEFAVVLTALAADLQTPPEQLPGPPTGRVLGAPGAARTLTDARVSDVVEGFLAAVTDHPDEPALRCGDDTLTFAELSARAGALAAGIRGAVRAQLGLPCGQEEWAADRLVAVALPRGTDAVAALLACFAAGTGYLPLEPDLPADRLADILADAAPAAVLAPAGSVVAELAARAGIQPVRMNTPADRMTSLTGRPVPGGCTAYVIYTSGSTGRPKGVVISRDSLDAQFVGLRDGRHAELVDRLAADGRTRVRALHSASFAFDTSFDQLHWLFDGHELLVLDEQQRRDPAEFVAIVRARYRRHRRGTGSRRATARRGAAGR